MIELIDWYLGMFGGYKYFYGQTQTKINNKKIAIKLK